MTHYGYQAGDLIGLGASMVWKTGESMARWAVMMGLLVLGLGCHDPLAANGEDGSDAGGDTGVDVGADEPDVEAGEPDVEAGEADVGEVGEPDVIEEPDAEPSPDLPFVLYLHPEGDDGASGLAPDDAILTMARAHEILLAEQPDSEVEILVAPGRYHAQEVVWTYTHPEHQILISRLDDDADRPVFDGCDVANPSDTASQCNADTWFRLNQSAGEPTNLNFHYIRVERYRTAISLNGNRNNVGGTNGHNRIYGCYFRHIGNGFAPHLEPSTAVVRLVNSDHNEIANNHFVDVINTTSLNRIHAIYVAHLSSYNAIERNRFVNNTGDAVRVRDYSNYNQILENRFIKAGQFAGYTEWYCDHDVRDDCTKQDPECPSWHNEFRDNELDGNYQCEVLGTFEYFQGEATTGCSPPTPTSPRLSTSGNFQAGPTPCYGY